MTAQITKKHHYIPQFLIKNFCDTDGKLFIYDKQADRFLGKKSPGGIFYELHRNTINMHGSKVDNMEQLYSALDDRFAKAIQRVVSAKKISVEDLMSILLFAATLKWRVPAIDNTFNTLKEEVKYADLPITIRPVDQNGDVSQEMLDYILQSDAFRESMRMIFPFVPFLTGEKLLEYHDGAFINTNERVISVLGDCGLIEQQGENINDLGNFVLPLSSTDTFIFKKGSTTNIKTVAFFSGRDILSVIRSERYIACMSKDHLENVIKAYKEVKEKGAEKIIESIVFRNIY
ncbi:MAG: DUF4238 domain-containing protein [Bacteroidetes bacterium]|nr:DUF4238 domain-containing protein [Bacteroidota bacterium]